MTNVPVPLTVRADDARRPAVFSTGIGSPVTIDSSTALAPSSTTPSTGTFSPGPDAQAIADVNRVERHVLFGAVVTQSTARDVGARPSSLRMAAPVWLRARSSSTWPSRTSVDDDRGRLEVDARPRPSRRGTLAETCPERASRRRCST